MRYIVSVLIILIVILSCIILFPRDFVTIDDTWVINLDKDTERRVHIENQAKEHNIKIQRWPATYGKTEQADKAYKDGVSGIILFQSDIKRPEKQNIGNNNLGAVGCWLSHKRLLQHLSKLPVSGSHGHLILEDDINLEGINKWEIIAKEIPADYDMVFLSMNHPICKEERKIHNHVYKAITTYDGNGNWGTQAYLVRHRSLAKILSKLKFMSHPIDEQYNFNFDSLNVYIVQPSLLQLSSLSKISSIDIAK